jgi:hypothetical protein
MSNQITQPMTANYLFQALITELISNRNVLQKGITPQSQIIQIVRNTDYTDFAANGFKYIFIFDEPLSSWLENTDDGNKQARIINHEQISYNYYTPLLNSNGETTTIGTLLSDQTLFGKKSIQTRSNGPTLGEYLTSFLGAYKQIQQQGNAIYNMEDVGVFQPRFYLATYNILSTATNQVSEKTSIICVMKYLHIPTGVMRIIWSGTGFNQIVPNIQV